MNAPLSFLDRCQPASNLFRLYFETVSQIKPSNALYDFPEYRPYHVSLQLVTASQTNANHIILHIISIADSQTH